jgi:hypothetical protein
VWFNKIVMEIYRIGVDILVEYVIIGLLTINAKSERIISYFISWMEDDNGILGLCGEE